MPESEVFDTNMSEIQFRSMIKTITKFDTMGSISGGTPLSQAIIVMDKVVGEFKAKHKVEICNLIVITDGSGDSISTTQDFGNCDDKLAIELPECGKTLKHTAKYSNTSWGVSTLILKAIKEKHKVNVIGIHIAKSAYYSMQTIGNDLNRNLGRSLDVKMDADGFVMIPNSGLDQFFIFNPKVFDKSAPRKMKYKIAQELIASIATHSV